MRTATLGALMLGLAVASLGTAQPLPTPAVPSTPTALERFVTWVKTPPKAAVPRKRAADGSAVELPAAPAAGESDVPALPSIAPVSGPAPSSPAPPAKDESIRTSEASTPPPAASSSAGVAKTSTSPASASPRWMNWLHSSAGPTPPAARTATLDVPTPPNPATRVQAPAIEFAPPPTPAGAAPVPAPTLEPEPPAAQLPPPTPLNPGAPVIVTPESLEPSLGFSDEVFVYDSPGACWTSAEFLIWRTLRGPLAYPLVTSTLTSTGTGVVNSSGTVNFFDKTNMSYPTYSGARVTLGMWLDSGERIGAEVSGFFVNTPGIHFKSVASSTQPAQSGPAGPQGPIAIYEPFINSTTGAASAQVIGVQLVSQGFINIDSSSDLNGAEINLVKNMYRGPACRIELLGGYRYLNLKEDLNIVTNTNASGTTTALSSPNQFLIMDNFSNRNQFNGPQLGGRVAWHRDCFTCSVSGKLALGVTQEKGSINGATTFFSSSLPPVTTTGGIYAQPSNIGSFSRNQFAAVPQLGINLGYQAGKHCYFYLGYDFLYWSRVARPGDMVNPLLNPASIVSNPSFTGAGTTQPAQLFLSRDFWAQGVDMGVEVKY